MSEIRGLRAYIHHRQMIMQNTSGYYRHAMLTIFRLYIHIVISRVPTGKLLFPSCLLVSYLGTKKYNFYHSSRIIRGGNFVELLARRLSSSVCIVAVKVKKTVKVSSSNVISYMVIIRWRSGHTLQSIKNHETCAIHLNNWWGI